MKIEFNYLQSRTIARDLFYYNQKGDVIIKNHFIYVALKDLPTNIPTDPNPRKANIKAKPCKQMINTLESKPEIFTDCNRGLVLLAKDVKYLTNGSNKKILIDFDTDDEGNNKGGLVDGGHTYKVLKSKKNYSELYNLPIFITIIEGVDSFSADLARARNTSVQVTEKSIAHLEKQFEPIKQALGNYSKKIIYFENENKESDNAVYKIEDLVALMTALNKNLYDENNQPVISYTGITSCFNKWINKAHRPTYEKIYPILKSVLDVYEHLYSNYEKYAKQAGYKQFGRINGVERCQKNDMQILTFTGNTANYRIAKGFIMPIFASLRFLLGENNSGWFWETNPEKFLDKHAYKLVKKIIDAHSNEYGSNPNKTGKSKVLWENIATAMSNYWLQEKIKRQ